MSLSQNVQDVVVRIATESKVLRTYINGNQSNLSALKTEAKANLVAAINELVDSIGGAGATINDAAPSTTSVYSSSKTEGLVSDAVAALVDESPETLDTLKELAAALGDDPNFATTVTNLIGTKADDNVVVKLTGNQTIAGVKTFSSAPVVPANSFDISDTTGLQTALDGKAPTTHTHTAAQLPSASETAKGVVELATVAETEAGTDSTRAVTPASFKGASAAFATKADVGDTTVDYVSVFEAGLT